MKQILFIGLWGYFCLPAVAFAIGQERYVTKTRSLCQPDPLAACLAG